MTRRLDAVLWALGLGLTLAGCVATPRAPAGTVAAVVRTDAPGVQRPLMPAEDAARHTAVHYLADGPMPWQPPAFDARDLKPDFIVAADGSGTHRTVQAAVDAVPAAGAGARRHVIQIRPGSYRERLCVQGKAPLTLLGMPGDAAAVTLVEGRYNALPKRPGRDAAHPCWPDLAAASHGTPDSASAAVSGRIAVPALPMNRSASLTGKAPSPPSTRQALLPSAVMPTPTF